MERTTRASNKTAINPDDGAPHPGGKHATRSSPDVKVRGAQQVSAVGLPLGRALQLAEHISASAPRMGTIAPGQVQPRQVGSPPQTRVPR